MILLSPLWRPQEVAELPVHGFDRRITKPVHANALYAALAGSGHQNNRSGISHAPSASPVDTSREARVLLAEDNVVNQKVFQKMLRKLGVQSDVVANGVEVIAALQDCHYSLVLMDCQMPEVDGYEATRLIRAGASGQGNRQVPIVAITANALESNREACFAVGMDDYVTKPIQIDELERVVSSWLRQHGVDCDESA